MISRTRAFRKSLQLCCLRADVSYFLCCTRKRACNKGNRRRLHAGKQLCNWKQFSLRDPNSLLGSSRSHPGNEAVRHYVRAPDYVCFQVYIAAQSPCNSYELLFSDIFIEDRICFNRLNNMAGRFKFLQFSD